MTNNQDWGYNADFWRKPLSAKASPSDDDGITIPPSPLAFCANDDPHAPRWSEPPRKGPTATTRLLRFGVRLVMWGTFLTVIAVGAWIFWVGLHGRMVR